MRFPYTKVPPPCIWFQDILEGLWRNSVESTPQQRGVATAERDERTSWLNTARRARSSEGAESLDESSQLDPVAPGDRGGKRNILSGGTGSSRDALRRFPYGHR